MTERERAERMLSESDQRFRSLVEQTSVGVAIIDLTGAFTYVNGALAELLGYSVEAVLGRRFSEFLHPDDAENVTKLLLKAISSPIESETIEFRAMHRDGRVLHLMSKPTRYTIDGRTVGFQAIIIDTTERENTEEALRRSEERYRIINQNMSEGVWLMDMNLKPTYISPSVTRARGYTLEELYALPLDKQVTPDSLKLALETLQEVLREVNSKQTGRPLTRTLELEFIRKDGSTFWSENTFTLLMNSNDEPAGILAVSRDITERKRAEEVLKESEERFRQAMEAASDGLWDWNVETGETYFSPAYTRMLGYEPSELPGLAQSWMDLIHPDDRNGVLRGNQDCIENRIPNFAIEFRMRTKSGGWKWILGRGHAGARDANGRALRMIGTHQDITERKQTESALQERMKELGCLYGVARAVERHDSSLDAIMAEVTPIIPSAYRYPDVACARIVLGNQMFESPGFKESRWSQSADIRVLGNIAGRVEVYYMEEKPRSFEGPFLEEERALIDAVAERLGKVVERKRVQDALRESEDRLRRITSNMLDMVVETDLQGICKYVSQSHKAVLGYDPEDLLGKSLFDLVHPEDLGIVMETVQRAISTDRLWTGGRFECRYRHADGHYVWLEVLANIVRDEKGEMIGGVLSSRDITERKRLANAVRESEERYRDLFENATDLIQAVGGDGKFEYVNGKWLKALGYSQEEVKQLTLMDILRKDQVSHFMELFERVRRGEVLDRVETVFVSKDGREILVEGNVNGQFKDGQFVATRGIFRDITERKKIERMKDQFVSMVSHELRTPLTSIRASLGLLASGVVGALPGKGQRMLEIAVTNTDRLVRLINDILDSERLVSGKTPMEKKQCSTAQLVKQASDVMKPMAEKAGVSLSVESQDAELWADPDRIVQALTNLISNAIKFSQKGGKIRVTAEHKENQMLFRVQDEGRGIPPDKLGLLFERFQQLDSSDAREKGGSGLGLSISRSIIEQHNGKIWVESKVGKGSTFLFTLPLLEAQVPFQPEATTGAPSTRKVLIIEDDPDLANILAAMLERHNIQSHIALTGGNGIALSRQKHPDLIVLDLILPDIDGSIVVETLRKDNILRSVPLVVYTVRELDKQQRENLRLGETLFFTKSRIPPEQFEEKVVQFMKRVFTNRGETSVS